jgi:hypothetical protein
VRNLRSAVAIVTLIVVTACGSSSAARVIHSPSPHPSPSVSASSVQAFPSPSPGTTTSLAPLAFSCSSPPAPGEHLVLVTISGIAGILVRDISDLNHPANRCSFGGGGSYFKFYSTTRVSYIVSSSGDLGAAGALYLADLTTGKTSLVRAWTAGGYDSWIYGWSPDGRELTYLSSDNSGLQWHLLSAAGDKVLSNLGTVPARDANGDNDDTMVGFSADGQYVAVETTFTSAKGASTPPAPPVQVNRVADGSIAYSRTDGTMAAWAGAGARLYFRTASGIQLWSPTAGVISVARASWIHPVASPDGSRIAFSVLNAQQNHVGEVLDLTAGTIKQLSSNPRVGAAFLNESLVWYAGESICTTATPCGLGGPPLSGKTYVYDLGSDVETLSIDSMLYDSWPHVVGQS